MKRYEAIVLICALIGLGVALMIAQRTINHPEPEKEAASENLAIMITANGVNGPHQDIDVAEQMQFVAHVSESGNQKLYYQWWKDAKPIAEATDSTYTIIATTHSDEGMYNCTATDEEKVARDWKKLWRYDE